MKKLVLCTMFLGLFVCALSEKAMADVRDDCKVDISGDAPSYSQSYAHVGGMGNCQGYWNSAIVQYCQASVNSGVVVQFSGSDNYFNSQYIIVEQSVSGYCQPDGAVINTDFRVAYVPEPDYLR